jgi:hypothetical protein
MTFQIEKWDCFEYILSHESSANPFTDVSLEGSFTLKNRQIIVSGFYDGRGVFKVRFMPNDEGLWRFETRSNVPELDGQEGEFLCVTASEGNHGPVRVANTHQFAYADGTPYIPVGTTCYVWNLQGDKLEEKTIKTLEQTPFNKTRMCVFPKRYHFNQNEPPSYPFLSEDDGWDFSRFNPEYFQHLEKRILDLQRLGIEADLILFHPYDNGAWGFDKMPAEANDRYLRYLVARLAAIRNVWWSFANEYDLLVERTMADWDHYMQLVQQIDPYNHLRSIHNCFSFYDHTKPWVTHCSIQHHDTSRVPVWLNKYNKPVVVDECGYEGDIQFRWGDLSPEEMVMRFWIGFTQGGYVGYGETYINEEEILWWSKGGDMRGDSIPRIAFLRQIFEQSPTLTPVERIESEEINFWDIEIRAEMFDGQRREVDLNPALAGQNCDAAGYNTDQGYYLFYFGMHQPGSANFHFSKGSYRIDLIDTWNMTIETAAERAAGQTCVEMPSRKFMAIRIRKNS